jgi:hypothetical protein
VFLTKWNINAQSRPLFFYRIASPIDGGGIHARDVNSLVARMYEQYHLFKTINIILNLAKLTPFSIFDFQRYLVSVEDGKKDKHLY